MATVRPCSGYRRGIGRRSESRRLPAALSGCRPYMRMRAVQRDSSFVGRGFEPQCTGRKSWWLCELGCGVLRSDKGAQAGDVAAHQEGLDRLGSLVGVDGLNIGHVPDDVVLEQDAVAAQQISCLGEDFAGLLRVVQLAERRDRVGEL